MLTSTHNDEEFQFLPIIKKLLSQIDDLKIIIAPRHPERAESILSFYNKYGILSKLVDDRKDIKEEILGPVNAPIFKLNQKYRCRLLLRSKKNILIQKKLAKILRKIKIYSGIKLTVDVDPITFN